jgi:glycosyltransferase involved in cell wall biosynthesis
VRRVCHITTVHPVADTRILHKECASLREAGYDVTLIAPHAHDCTLEGIRVLALRPAARNRLERMARRPRAAYRTARALDADLYHFHDPDFLPFAARLARATGKRVVYDAHEDIPVQIRHKDWLPAFARAPAARAGALVEAQAIRRIAGVVAVNEDILERLRRHQRRGVVVTNYPRLEEIVPAHAWAARERAACYVGAITRVRGAHELVAAMAHTDAVLYLAGAISPPALAAELERSPGWPRVRYLGTLDRGAVAKLLARVKVGVIPLHPIENYVNAYPVKLFEYMAAGIPVVATDVPRWRALLDGHRCGVCFAPRSPRALGAAISGLLDDDERAGALGARGRRAALERYSWESKAGALLRFYDELLA